MILHSFSHHNSFTIYILPQFLSNGTHPAPQYNYTLGNQRNRSLFIHLYQHNISFEVTRSTGANSRTIFSPHIFPQRKNPLRAATLFYDNRDRNATYKRNIQSAKKHLLRSLHIAYIYIHKYTWDSFPCCTSSAAIYL